jgi:hypothetical protein
MFKTLIIIAAIAGAIFFGVKYHDSHSSGTTGINVHGPVIRPPAVPNVLGS